MIWVPPAPEPRWLEALTRREFKVGRKRWRAVHPVTYITVAAGWHWVELLRPTGRGELTEARMRIDVHPGQWRQLALGPDGMPPPIFDERRVNINTFTTIPSARQVVRGLLATLLALVGFVIFLVYLFYTMP